MVPGLSSFRGSLQTFGGNALNTLPNLQMVGNAASATGYRFQDVAFWTARLYDAMQNGQPLGEAMMNLQQMGVVSGATRNQIEQLQKEGAKGPALWEAYSKSQARFNGMMEQQATTFTGRLSTMKDSLNMLLAQAGKPIFDTLSNGLGRFNDLLASPMLATFVGMVANGLAGAFGAVGSAVAAVVPKIQAIGGILSAVFQGFSTGNFNGVFGPILAGLDQLSSGAGTKLAGFVSAFLNVFQVIRDSAITFVQAVSGNWQGAFDTRINGTVKLFGVLGTAINGLAQWFTGTALPAAQVFFGWLQSSFTTIMGVVGPFLAGFGAVVATIGAGGAAFAALAAVAMPAILAVGAALSFLLSPIGLIAAGVGLLAAAWVNDWGGIQGIVAQVWAVVQQGAATVLPILLQGFQMVSAAITAAIPYVQQFGQFLLNAFQTIAPVVQQFGQAIMAGVGGALQQIIPLVQGFANAFMAQLPAIQGLWQQLIGVWQSAQGVMSALAPVIQLIAGLLGGALIAAVGVALGAVGGIVSAFTGALPGAMQAASGALQMMGAAFDILAALITGVVGIVSNLLQGNWAAAWQAAQTMVSNVATGIGNLIQGMVTAVTGLITALVGGVQGMISGFTTTIVGYFTALTSDSSNQVSQLVSQVLNWFNQLPGRVGGAMQSLASTVTGALGNLKGSAASAASGIGSAIIDGIANAISAGVGRLASIASGAVNSAIEAAKNALGIRSPSKVFADMGEMSMQGLADGISNRKNIPVLAADTAVADTIKAASAALDGANGLLAPDTGAAAKLRAFVDTFRDAAVYTVQGFAQMATMLAGDGLAQMQAFALAADGALSFGVQGVAKFQALAATNPLSQEAVDTLLGGIVYVIQRVTEIAANMGTAGLNQALAFLQASRDVFAAFATAIGKIVDLEKLKDRPSDVLGAFVKAMEEALSRAEDLVSQSEGILAASEAYRTNMAAAAANFAAGAAMAPGGGVSFVGGGNLAAAAGAAPATLSGGAAESVVVNVAGSVLTSRDLQEVVIEAVNDGRKMGRL